MRRTSDKEEQGQGKGNIPDEKTDNVKRSSLPETTENVPPPSLPGDTGKAENEAEKPTPSSDPAANAKQTILAKGRYSFPGLTRKVINAYTPLKIVFSIFGRFPLSLKTSANGTLTFVAKDYSVNNIAFFATSFLHLFLFVLFIVNCVGLRLNSPPIKMSNANPKWFYPTNGTKPDDLLQFEEWYIFRRNILPCVILFSSSLHIVVCSWNWMWKRHFIADFMNFWAVTEHQTHLEVTGYTLYISVCLLVSYGIIVFSFAVTMGLHMTPICTGAPAVLVQMIFRCFYPEIHTSSNFVVYRGIAAFLFLYLMLCTKLYIMLFMIHCYMIKHTIREWNRRVEEALNEGKTFTDSELVKKRSSGVLLFQDQVSLLDLIEGNDTLFGNIIESYYLSEVMIIVFDVYFLYRVELNQRDFSGIRTRDRIFVMAHLIFTLGSMLLASIFAGQIGEETLNGIQSVRNKGLLGRKDETQLNLVLSMYYNYVGYWETVVNGAKYFPINKQLFMKALAFCMTYAFFLVQFEMEFTYTGDEDKDPGREINFQRLMENVETVSHGWWNKNLKGERFYRSKKKYT